MDSLFERFFEGWPFRAREAGEWMPAMDMSEKDKEIIVKAEIPGMDPKDIDISLQNGLLTVRGERKQEKEEKEESFHRVERSHGVFSRTIRLPAEVDEDKVKATYKDGVLTLEMSKTKEAAAKKIEVKAT
jgi:HSP20 family protein